MKYKKWAEFSGERSFFAISFEWFFCKYMLTALSKMRVLVFLDVYKFLEENKIETPTLNAHCTSIDLFVFIWKIEAARSMYIGKYYW